jgi:hypothetical protein
MDSEYENSIFHPGLTHGKVLMSEEIAVFMFISKDFPDVS